VEKQLADRSLTRSVVKTAASLVRSVAKDSVDGRCFALLHQPKEPKDLATRLEAMNRK